MGKQLVRAVRLNWDVEYLHDIITGKGFVISEPATFNMEEGKQKALYGSRSILYGSNYEDETAFIERYRCNCGEFKGKLFEGEVCPLCGTKVEFKDSDIEVTGWIPLGDNYIINPFYYNKLCECIGRSTMPEIVIRKTKVDLDGNLSLAKAEEIEEKPKHPFVGIGIVEFRKRFEEIIAYFRKKKKKKAEEFDRLLKESSSVFCSHIPIYSTMLRPQSSTSDTYYFNPIDRHVNPLFALSEKLRDAEEIDKYVILGRIQNRVNALWNENFNMLNGKEGLIRGQILGGSLDIVGRSKTYLIAGTLR